MKNFFKSFIISFSMYSILPMPRIDWDRDSMKYTFFFLPWIGLLMGGLTYGWFLLSAECGFNSVFTAVILALLPIVLSGGIHMDGLIDTCDAIFSYGEREKKLEILKDPRTGAFGVIGCAVYLLLLLGSYSQLLQTPKYAAILLLTFFVSRSLGAIALLSVAKAKKDGLGTTFADAAGRRFNLTALYVYLVAVFVLMLCLNWILGVVLALVLGGYVAWYIRSIKKNFGGITGDLTGFLISSSELVILFVTVIFSAL
jgi:cobalamin 5''-phosphate synthase/cobalamin synthase